LIPVTAEGRCLSQRFDSVPGTSHAIEQWEARKAIDALLDKISADHDAWPSGRD